MRGGAKKACLESIMDSPTTITQHIIWEIIKPFYHRLRDPVWRGGGCSMHGEVGRRRLVVWVDSEDKILIELYGESHSPLVWTYGIDDLCCFKKAREIIWSIVA